MTADPSTPAIEDLLSHANWVRALARSLVTDPAVAEDAVQDTWLAALESPPRTGENPRGWLATVLRNALRMRARSGGRRSEHEARAARPDAKEDEGSVLVTRVETQRRLAAAVTRLDEPARSTVILRYYEGLSAAEIARRTNVPAGTVRWRLSKAMDELRDQLDDDFGGDRAAWMALVLPLAQGPPPIGAGPHASDAGLPEGGVGLSKGASVGLFQGFLAMNALLKLTVAAGLAAILILITTLGANLVGTGLEEPPPEDVAFRPLASAPGERGELADSGDTGAREPIAVDPVATTEVASEFGVDVRLRLVDERGDPVAGAEARLGSLRDARARSESTRARSDASGFVELALGTLIEGDAPYVELEIDHPDFVLERVGGQVAAVGVTELGDVRLTGAGAVSGVVHGSDGAPIEGAWVEWAAITGADSDLERARLSRTVRNRRSAPVSDASGRFTLRRVPAGLVHVWAGPVEELDALAVRSGVVEVRTAMVSEGVELRLGELDEGDLILGRVVDPDGDPIPGAKISYDYKRLFGSGSGSTNADQEGRFVLASGDRGPWNLTASDPDGRFTSARAEDVDGGADLLLRLTAPEFLELTILSDGKRIEDLGAMSGLSVAAFNPKHTRVLAFEAVEFVDGVARIPVPVEEFVIEVSANGHEERELGPFDGLHAPRKLSIDLASLPGIRGRVLVDGAPAEGAKVEWYEAARNRTVHNGFPVRVQESARDTTKTDAEGAFALDLRESVELYVRAELPGFAPTEIGPLQVDPGRGVSDLVLTMTAGGALEGYALPAAPGLIVGISRADACGQTTRTDANGFYRFEHLTPGPWLVERREREITAYSAQSETSSKRFRESDLEFNCTVIDGQTTRFDLASPADLEARVHGTLSLGGHESEGYMAALSRSEVGGNMAMQVASAPVLADGTFELRVAEPGQYRMSLNRPDGKGATILAVLDLAPGENAWSAAFATGTVRVTGASEMVGGQIPLEFVRAEQGETLVLIPLSRGADEDAEGARELAGVPAVSGEVVRFTVQDLMTADDPRDAGVVVQEITIPAGGVVDVVLED